MTVAGTNPWGAVDLESHSGAARIPAVAVGSREGASGEPALLRVLLADDHALIRDGLRAIFDGRPGVEVVGEASSGREAISLAASLRPDVVMMDIAMPDLNGVEATRCLIAENPTIRVIALTMHSDRRYVVAMFRAGAAGYCLKDGGSQTLLNALDAVARGQRFVDPSVASVVIACVREGLATSTPKELSPREREVLQLLAEGRTSRDMAARLHVALATVETHRRQIMIKLDIHTVAGLTKYAIREGITSLER